MPKPQRGRGGGGSQNRGGGGGGFRGNGRGGGSMGHFMSGDDFIAAQVLNEEVSFGRSQSGYRGRGGGGSQSFRGRGGSSNHFDPSNRGRGNSNGFSTNRGRGRGGFGFDNSAKRGGRGSYPNAPSSNPSSTFKGKENLRVKNAQSVPFDYTKVMATTTAFRGKGSRTTERSRGNSDKDQNGSNQEVEMQVDQPLEEDLQAMLAEQLEADNPISATEIADSLAYDQGISSKSKGKHRAISEDSGSSDEDIVLEPPAGYVHKIKPHLERGYPLSTEEDTMEEEEDDEEEEEEEDEDYGGMEEEERYIYEDDVPDLPGASFSLDQPQSNHSGKPLPLFSFNSFTSSTSATPTQIQADNQRKVPVETFVTSNEGSSSNPSSSVISSAGIASIIPTGPSSSAGNRWWGAVGLPSARKSGMGSSPSPSSGNDFINQERSSTPNKAGDTPVVSNQRAQQMELEQERLKERREAADRAREAERVQAQLIQNASHQPQGAHTGIGSASFNNQPSGIGSNNGQSNLNPALSEALSPMNSYSKGTNSDYQEPKHGYEPYVPAKKILPPLPPGAASRFQNSMLPARGAFTNERLVFRIPVAFVKATGDWKNGRFEKFDEDENPPKGYEDKKRKEVVEGWGDEERTDAMQAMESSQDQIEGDDTDDLMRKLQESYPGLEITMEEVEEVEVEQSLQVVDQEKGRHEEGEEKAIVVDEIDTKVEEDLADEDEEILIPPSSSLTALKEVSVEDKVEPESKASIPQESEALEEEDQEELDQDELNEELQTKLALEQAKTRMNPTSIETETPQSNGMEVDQSQDQELSFVIDVQGESPSEVESKSQHLIDSNQSQSWTLGSSKRDVTSNFDSTPQETNASSSSSIQSSKVSPWEAATGSSSSHPRMPRDRSQGSKNRNALKKSRRRARMSKFNGNQHDDGSLLEMENNERIPREGDSDLDWGSDGPPGRKDRKEDQSQDDSDDEDGQVQRAIRESLGLNGTSSVEPSRNLSSKSQSIQPKFNFKKGKKGSKYSNGIDEAILKDYMENALDINSDSGEVQDQEALLNFLKSMDPQRGGRQMDEMDILIEKKMEEEDEWMSVSEDDDEVQEDENKPNGLNSTLTRKALERGTSPGNASDSTHQEKVSAKHQSASRSKKGKRAGQKNDKKNLGKFSALMEEDSDEEMDLDLGSDSEEEDDSDGSELDRAIRKSEKHTLGLDSESSSDDSDSDSSDNDDDDEDEELDGFGLGNGRGFNNRLKGSKKGKNAWTWAQEDEEVVDALEAFASSHDRASVGRDGKARDRLFKAIEKGDFGSIDMDDIEFDPDDPAYGVASAVRGSKGGKNRSKRFNEDDLFSDELQSQWQRDRAKKAAAKKARQAEREAAALNAFKNTHGKNKKGNSKAARRAEKRARKATEAGEFIQDGLEDDEDVMMADLNTSFGGSGGLTSSKKFNQKISSNPTIKGDYLRQAQTLQEVNEQIKVFLRTQGHTTLVLPAMDKRARAQVHLLANAYDLKSKSMGKNDNRFPTLIKNNRSGQIVDHKKINQVLSGRSNFKFGSSDNRHSGGGKGGKKDKKTVGATGGGSMAPKNREGTQVGFGADKIGSENVGHKLLSMMGWNEGNGLGNQRMEGINEPVGATVKISKGGLGF